MKKYLITIINLTNYTKHHLERDETNISETVNRELGGWNNLYGSSSTDRYLDDFNYQQAGVTKDQTKMYSILAYIEEV